MNTSTPTEEMLALAYKIGTRNDSEGGVRKLQSYFQEKFVDCLDRGADPNGCDKDGRDAMELIGRIGEKSTQLASRCVQLLLERGYDFIDRDGPAKLKGLTAERTWRHLARQARDGKSHTGRNGDNVLHYLAQYQPAMLHHWLRMDRIRRKQDKPLFHVKQARHARGDGSTPLHLVWQERRLPLAEEAQLQCWQVARYLVDLGARMDLCNGRGQDVYRLIQRQMMAGKIKLPGTTADAADQAFAAQVQQHLLERATPQADGGGRRKGPRL